MEVVGLHGVQVEWEHYPQSRPMKEMLQLGGGSNSGRFRLVKDANEVGELGKEASAHLQRVFAKAVLEWSKKNEQNQKVLAT